VAYSWPGNDFELNSIVENIAISSEHGHIRLSNLPGGYSANTPVWRETVH
jgi:transcriptional activator for dhaKLM operon